MCMPELPDIAAYISALETHIVAQPLERVRLASPFLLRTAQPPVMNVEGRVVRELRRIGKRIAIGVDGDLWLVLHLMIAGRLHWRPPGAKIVGTAEFGGVGFSQRLFGAYRSWHQAPCIFAYRQWRGGLALIDPEGIEVFASDFTSFRATLMAENRTLKRALTDPRLLSGIGNAYSDEILHAAQLSPITLTHKLQPLEWERLFAATRHTLALWIDRLRGAGGGRVSRKGDRVSQRHGRSRPVWRALSELRRKDSADSVRGQRNELLRSMPDRRKSACGSQFVAAIAIGLAAHAGRTGGS